MEETRVFKYLQMGAFAVLSEAAGGWVLCGA